MKRKILSSIIALFIMLSCAVPALAAFTDVPSNHKHKAAIDYCTKNEFLVGRGGGIFDPDGTITRAEFITVWAKTFHARRHNFHDATKTKDDTDNAIVLMQGLGYINGVSSTEFSRYTRITREEVAQIVFNTYLKGISSDKEYENYTDHANVAVWARHAVSVCYKKGIFTGIVEDNAFKPGQHMTRAEVCVVLMRLLKEEKEEKVEVKPQLYSITVADMTDGTVIADKDKAAEGETVTLTVTPDDGFKLKEGTLKYNGNEITDDSFTMPDDDVVITAEFEAE